VTRTEDCLVTSYSTMLIVVRRSPTQFYLAENWMQDNSNKNMLDIY